MQVYAGFYCIYQRSCYKEAFLNTQLPRTNKTQIKRAKINKKVRNSLADEEGYYGFFSKENKLLHEKQREINIINSGNQMYNNSVAAKQIIPQKARYSALNNSVAAKQIIPQKARYLVLKGHENFIQKSRSCLVSRIKIAGQGKKIRGSAITHLASSHLRNQIAFKCLSTADEQKSTEKCRDDVLTTRMQFQ